LLLRCLAEAEEVGGGVGEVGGLVEIVCPVVECGRGEVVGGRKIVKFGDLGE